MSEKKVYKEYFDIDPKYYAAVTADLIKQGKVSWKNFYPHETFVKLLEKTHMVLSGKDPRLRLPGVRMRYHRRPEAAGSKEGTLGGRKADNTLCKKGLLLDQYALQPFRPVFRDCEGIYGQQGGPGEATELRKLLACGTVGGHQAKDQQRPCYGAADGAYRVYRAGLDEAAYRRRDYGRGTLLRGFYIDEGGK